MNAEQIFEVIRRPRMSEKTARMQAEGQYCFEVLPTATKADVKAAVEQLFSVSVVGLQIVNIRGKTRTFRSREGQRNGIRKAYVRLADGQSIDLGLTG